MTCNDIDQLLGSILKREMTNSSSPSAEDWTSLAKYFKCEFNDEFRCFISLMSKYQFPGEILNVTSSHVNGNDTILVAYEAELSMSDWKANMIPFYAIGNGDYFCLNKDECPDSMVYYFYYDRGEYEVNADSFELWLLRLPKFLA